MLRLGTLGGAPLGNALARVTGQDGTQSLVPIPTAQTTLPRDALPAAPATLEVTRAYTPGTGDPRITAADALDILRMAVGLAPGFGPARGPNFVAADINRDGRVTAADALDVLRAAVNLPAPSQPVWIFVEADTDWATLGLSRNQTEVPTRLALGPDWTGGALDLTGILLGSVVAQT